MIGTIRKHSKVLWWFVVVVVIITFVIFFSPHQPQLGGTGPDGGRGTVFNRPVKQDEYDIAYRMARLNQLMQGQQRRVTSEEEVRQAYQYIFFQEKMRQLGVRPGDDAVAAFVRKNLVNAETGENQYDQYVQFLKGQGFTELDLIEYYRLNLGIGHLMDLALVGASLVTPRQAELAFRRENEQALTSAVFFASSNHLATVEITPEGLGEFFTNRLASYRTPDRKQVSFLKFAHTNYLEAARAELDKVPELRVQMESFYDQQGADAFRDDEDQVMTREAALAQLEESQLENVAHNLARRDAVEFYNELAQRDADHASFVALAESKGLELGETQPLSAFDFSPDLSGIRNLNQVLGQLRPDQPISEPQTAADAVYLLALSEVVPSAVPPLDEVRARVTADFRRARAMETARSEGEIFRVIATNAIAGGKTLAAIAEEQGMVAVDLPPLTLAANTVSDIPPGADLTSLKNTAFALEPGKLSEFVAARDGGYVLLLKELQPPSDETVKAALSSYLEEMRQRNRQTVFNSWFRQEFANSGLQAFLDKNLGSDDMATP
jgi:hypothetical protein